MPNGRGRGIVKELRVFGHMIPVNGQQWCSSREASGPSEYFLNEFQAYEISEELPALTSPTPPLIGGFTGEEDIEFEVDGISSSAFSSRLSVLSHSFPVRCDASLHNNVHIIPPNITSSPQLPRTHSTSYPTIRPHPRYLQSSSHSADVERDPVIMARHMINDTISMMHTTRLGDARHPSSISTSGPTPTSPCYTHHQRFLHPHNSMMTGAAHQLNPRVQLWADPHTTHSSTPITINTYRTQSDLMDTTSTALSSSLPDYDIHSPYIPYTRRFGSEPSPSWDMRRENFTELGMSPVGVTHSGRLPSSLPCRSIVAHDSALVGHDVPLSWEDNSAFPSITVSNSFEHDDTLAFDQGNFSMFMSDHGDGPAQTLTPSDISIDSFPSIYADDDGVLHVG